MGATISLGEVIRVQREDKQHWSQPEAARRAGISTSYWRRIEGGGEAPAGTLARILYILRVQPDRLRRLGYRELADDVEKCVAVLGTDPGEDAANGNGNRLLPSFVASEAEAYLYEMPDVSESVRRALILHLRTLLRAESDPLARALLGTPAASARPARA